MKLQNYLHYSRLRRKLMNVLTATVLIAAVSFARADTLSFHFDTNSEDHNSIAKLEAAGWDFSEAQGTERLFEFEAIPSLGNGLVVGGNLPAETPNPRAVFEFGELESGSVQALVATTSSFSQGRLALEDSEGNVLFAHFQRAPIRFEIELESGGLGDTTLPEGASTNARNVANNNGYSIVSVSWDADGVRWRVDNYNADHELNISYEGDEGEFFAGGAPARLVLSTAVATADQRIFGFTDLEITSDTDKFFSDDVDPGDRTVVTFDVNSSQFDTLSKMQDAGWDLSQDLGSAEMFELQQNPALHQGFMIGGDLVAAPYVSYDFAEPMTQGMMQALVVNTSSFANGRLGLEDADGNILYAHLQVSPRNFKTELEVGGMDEDIRFENGGSVNARNAVSDYQTGYGIVTVRWTEESVSWRVENYFTDGTLNEVHTGEDGEFFAGGAPARIFMNTSTHNWAQRKFGFAWLTYSDDPTYDSTGDEDGDDSDYDPDLLVQRHFDFDDSNYNSLEKLEAWGWSFAGQMEELRSLEGAAGIDNYLYVGGVTDETPEAILDLGGIVHAGSLDLTIFTRSSAAQGRVQLLDEDMNVIFAFVPQTATRFWVENQGESLPADFDIPNGGSNNMINTPTGYSHAAVEWDLEGDIIWSWTHYNVDGTVNHEELNKQGSFLLAGKKPAYLAVRTLWHNNEQRAIGVADISVTMFDDDVYIEPDLPDYRELTPEEEAAFADFRIGLQQGYRQIVPDPQVEALLQGYSEGQFASLNYDRAGDAEIHFNNVTLFIQAYLNPDSSYYLDEDLADHIAAGFDFWISNDYQDSNWWHNVIGFQRRMTRPAILFADVLQADYPDVYEDVVGYFRRVYEYMIVDPRGGGTNLTDMSYNAIIGALLGWDIVQLEVSRDLLLDSIALRERGGDVVNGIYPDMSHLEHGPQFHNASYGHEFLRSLISAMELLNGSDWDLPVESYDLVEDIFLNGIAHMTYGRWFDFNAGGRSISRLNSHRVAGSFAATLGRFIAFETERVSELQSLQSRLSFGPTQNNYVDATKSFWFSEFISHIRPDYYSSVRLVSERTMRNESGNNEGRRNRHFGDGINFVLVHGDEYDYMPAVWNYERLPGLTAEQTFNFAPERHWGVSGRNRYAGTASNGRQGVAAMKLDHDGVNGNKSYFLFDNAIVAMGSQINGRPTLTPVFTTMNQTRRVGDIVYNSGGMQQTIQEGQTATRQLQGDSWIWHNDIGYIVPSGNDSAFIEARTVSGNYNLVGTSDRAVSEPVATFWFNHGPQPQGKNYSYIMLPAVSVEETEAAAAEPHVNVLHHSDSIHAVAHHLTRSVGIAFFEAGTVEISDGVDVTVDAPALVILRNRLGGMEVTVSDPEYRLTDLTLEIGMEFNDSRASYDSSTGISTIEITLPGGDWTGSPKRIHLPLAGLPSLNWNIDRHLGGNWKHIDGFGSFASIDQSPFVFHSLTNSYIYVVSDNPDFIVFYDYSRESWYWTRRGVFPFAFQYADSEWIEF